MSNVKKVLIQGNLPFDCANNEDFRHFLGVFNAPCMGIRIEWGRNWMIPNLSGGQTCMYRFEIAGEEAVSMIFIEKLKNAILNCWGGHIDKFYVEDIENEQVLIND